MEIPDAFVTISFDLNDANKLAPKNVALAVEALRKLVEISGAMANEGDLYDCRCSIGVLETGGGAESSVFDGELCAVRRSNQKKLAG